MNLVCDHLKLMFVSGAQLRIKVLIIAEIPFNYQVA